jgi:hypothetical protein
VSPLEQLQQLMLTACQLCETGADLAESHSLSREAHDRLIEAGAAMCIVAERIVSAVEAEKEALGLP